MKPKAPLNLLIDIRGWQEQTATLTPAEAGAFLKLKMHYWRAGQIPDRDAALAQIAGMGSKEWKDAREGLEPLFIVGNGEWFRADWSEELESAYLTLRKYREASKIANQARWNKQKRRGSTSDSESDSDSHPESGKDSESHPASLLSAHPASLLKYKGTPPSQEKDVFDPSGVDFEQAVTALESEWKEATNV